MIAHQAASTIVLRFSWEASRVSGTNKGNTLTPTKKRFGYRETAKKYGDVAAGRISTFWNGIDSAAVVSLYEWVGAFDLPFSHAQSAVF